MARDSNRAGHCLRAQTALGQVDRELDGSVVGCRARWGTTRLAGRGRETGSSSGPPHTSARHRGQSDQRALAKRSEACAYGVSRWFHKVRRPSTSHCRMSCANRSNRDVKDGLGLLFDLGGDWFRYFALFGFEELSENKEAAADNSSQSTDNEHKTKQARHGAALAINGEMDRRDRHLSHPPASRKNQRPARSTKLAHACLDKLLVW